MTLARHGTPRPGDAAPREEDHEVTRLADVDLLRNGVHLLDGVSLSIGAGEHWAVIGPNGAGKSTLLGLIGATTHPTRGAVYVLGHRLGRVDLRRLRTAIGHVDHRHRLEHPLTPIDVVLTGLTNTSVLPPRFEPSADQLDTAEDLLRRMGMGDRRHVRWPTMSQGERGRVLIARALIAAPRVLVLDEPATGLDVAGREELLETLAPSPPTNPHSARCWSPTIWRSCRCRPRMC